MPDKRMPARTSRGACPDCGAVKVSGVCPDCAGLLTLPVRDAKGRFIPGMAAFVPAGSTGSKDAK